MKAPVYATVPSVGGHVKHHIFRAYASVQPGCPARKKPHERPIIRGMQPAGFANHGMRKFEIAVVAPQSPLREPNVRQPIFIKKL